jgi:hypothetical protein
MNQVIIGIILVLLTDYCSRSPQHEVQACNEFEFKNLSTDSNNWSSEITFAPISQQFYNKYFQRRRHKYKNLDPSYIYYVCEIKNSRLKGIVVAIVIGRDLSMLYVSNKGGDPFLFAEHYFSADEVLVTKSKFENTNYLSLNTIRHNWQDGFYNKDSIKTTFYIDRRGTFKKVQTDSSRIFHEIYDSNNYQSKIIRNE